MARKSGGTRTALATIIILASLVIAMVVPQGQAVASSVGLTSNEAQMLALVNQARAEAGLAPLYAEQRLTDMARNYSSEMIQYDFFSHTSPVSGSFSTRVAAQGFTGYTVAGENIAKSPTVASAFAAFMNSEGHRANILRANYNCVGIGILDGPNGLVVTQEFMAFSQIPDTADVSGSSNPTTTPVTAASSSSFDTYYLVMNPNDTAARIDVIFQDDDGSRHTYSYTVAAHSRYTVPARETLEEPALSTPPSRAASRCWPSEPCTSQAKGVPEATTPSALPRPPPPGTSRRATPAEPSTPGCW